MINFEKLSCELDENLNLHAQLQKIFGVGKKNIICKKYGFSQQAHCGVMQIASNSEDFEFDIEYYILTYMLVEQSLRQEIDKNIKKKLKIRTYQGHRHYVGLPVRGQRTHTNSRTVRKLHGVKLVYRSGFKRGNLLSVNQRNALKKLERRKTREQRSKDKKRRLNEKLKANPKLKVKLKKQKQKK